MTSMGSVWDRTTEFLGDNLGRVLPIAIFAIFVPAVISGSLTELQPGATPGLKLGIGIGSLLLALVAFWGQLAVTALALDAADGRGATAAATRRLPAAILVMVAAFAAGLLAVIPIGVVLAAYGVDLMAMSGGSMPALPPGAALPLGLYLLALVPVMLWIASRLAVLLPVIVGEARGLGAIPRSWRLTRGVALRIAGVIILYAIVSMVAGAAAQVGVGTIFKLLIGSQPGISIASVLTSIIVAAVSTAFTVLATVFAAKLFVALLLRDGAARPR